ncbi:MAG: TetR/AcrR family transcriptional regulator [Parvibaculum sp.]|uniref:TetR/AcrR family transcriptional regulator n=1 Tax=Parvibaculum sp. TaxID=2024848 RepID=UPI0025FAAE1A|nr:TetR/AcrR family transcriptional regulator [Parvibaculum sp.]MCE9650138.1 TetR/AcrR family transcriptional regulator [Parvibaculum sp.]
MARAAIQKSAARVRDVKGEISAYKRRLILEEACHLFYAQGYEGATLDAVAERLNVTKPFIYSYYRNKAEILREISERGIRLCLAAIDETMEAGGPPLARLRVIVDRVTQLIIDNQEYIVVYQREEKNLEAQVARDIRKLRKAFDTRLEKLLAEGAASGAFAIDDTNFAAISISGLMSWVANWYVPGGRRSPSEVVVLTQQMVMQMVSARK